ncbi:hypothetical protein A9Q99_18000 [Gammaproteobacteria bacterium 45_16_T64]|nr:hypothetical protein A9Q99_18000 [Gammaproteobacteria bacterium 45_16_T64]
MRFLLVLITLLSTSVLAQEKPLLTWYLTNWPPAFIVDGLRQGTGYADVIVDILEREMPEYRHERQLLPYPRILNYIERGNEGCYPTNIYDKKHDFGVTSVPIVLVSGHSIYIHKDNLEKFPYPRGVSLAALLNNSALTLGVRGDLEFGSTLSPILKSHRNEKHMITRSGQDLVDGLVKMLDRRRIDYFIEYNFVMKFVTDKIGLKMDDFIEIPIFENRDEYVRGAVECPNSPWGKEVIVKVNKILVNLRETAEFRELNEKWFVSSSNKLQYWPKYQELILDITQ